MIAAVRRPLVAFIAESVVCEQMLVDAFVWSKSLLEARALMFLKSENPSLQLSTDWQVGFLVKNEA